MVLRNPGICGQYRPTFRIGEGTYDEYLGVRLDHVRSTCDDVVTATIAAEAKEWKAIWADHKEGIYEYGRLKRIGFVADRQKFESDVMAVTVEFVFAAEQRARAELYQRWEPDFIHAAAAEQDHRKAKIKEQTMLLKTTIQTAETQRRIDKANVQFAVNVEALIREERRARDDIAEGALQRPGRDIATESDRIAANKRLLLGSRAAAPVPSTSAVDHEGTAATASQNADGCAKKSRVTASGTHADDSSDSDNDNVGVSDRRDESTPASESPPLNQATDTVETPTNAAVTVLGMGRNDGNVTDEVDATTSPVRPIAAGDLVEDQHRRGGEQSEFQRITRAAFRSQMRAFLRQEERLQRTELMAQYDAITRELLIGRVMGGYEVSEATLRARLEGDRARRLGQLAVKEKNERAFIVWQNNVRGLPSKWAGDLEPMDIRPTDDVKPLPKSSDRPII